VLMDRGRRPFRFGVIGEAITSRERLLEVAHRAEALGYSTLLLRDHFVAEPFGDQLAPLVALTAAAGATRTLRVGRLVLDNDYRHPVVLAKELATLDVLSGGRLELGLGAGWMRSDYEQSGMPMDSPKVRVDRFEEGIRVLKNAFADGPQDFAGRHYTVTGYDGQPKPAQKPWPPFLIGGGQKRVLSIAGREADIVGINPSIPSGQVDAEAARDGAAGRTDQKVAWVKEAAGDRFGDIELNLLVFACVVTDDRPGTIEAMAPLFGLDPSEVQDHPHTMVGTVDQICEDLEARRERWGTSYITIQGDAMETAAPVVAKLAGT
jgi:probable F420-dependent oxidoreductase